MASSDLIFLHSGSIAPCHARVDKHFDGYYTLQFMERGNVEVAYDARTYLLTGPSFWPAYPGPRIRFHNAPGNDPWVHRYVAFRGPQANRWAAEGLLADSPQPAPPGQNHAARFDELLTQAQRTDSWGPRRAINMLEQFLLHLAEQRVQPPSAQPWLGMVLARLDARSGFTPDYAALAAELGLGLSTLRRQFKDATGTSLHRYTLSCRLAAARSLLGETDLPMKAVAERLGYEDLYFFCRQFRQHAGVSPAAYRKSRQR